MSKILLSSVINSTILIALYFVMAVLMLCCKEYFLSGVILSGIYSVYRDTKNVYGLYKIFLKKEARKL